MYKITKLENIRKENKFSLFLAAFISQIGGLLEVLIILSIWLLIFMNRVTIGDFNRSEVIAYLLFGNLIGLLAYFFLYRAIESDIRAKDCELLIYSPIQYFIKIFTHKAGRNLLPFILVVLAHILALSYLVEGFQFIFNKIIVAIIAIMIIFSFVIEFLLIYLAKFFIFWTIESEELYKNIIRLKKFFSGNYIPLSLLPFMYLQVGLLFPFAYSFYVPTELYLGRITAAQGLQGLEIQIVWIIALYFMVKFFWKKNKLRCGLKI